MQPFMIYWYYIIIIILNMQLTYLKKLKRIYNY